MFKIIVFIYNILSNSILTKYFTFTNKIKNAAQGLFFFFYIFI